MTSGVVRGAEVQLATCRVFDWRVEKRVVGTLMEGG